MLRTANADANTKDNANRDTSGSFLRSLSDADSDHLCSVSLPDQGHDADAPANAETEADAASPGAAARRPPERKRRMPTAARLPRPPECLTSFRRLSAAVLPLPRPPPAQTLKLFPPLPPTPQSLAAPSPPTNTIVPVRIALDDSADVANAVAAAAESIRAATEHSPVDLAQVRAWCGHSPSDPVCDAVLCIGKVSNASPAAVLASTGAAIALAVDTSADGGSVTSIHDGRMLDEDQAASIVGEFAFTVGHLVSALADKGTLGSIFKPSGQSAIVGNKGSIMTKHYDAKLLTLVSEKHQDQASFHSTKAGTLPGEDRCMHSLP
nr:hypothetical protein HK105_003432 [Polyrhizophydium stewartii]